MANPFLAEIRIFPFNFPPKGWAFCNGQVMPISQSTALFSLLGTTYGGDGKSNFALPNMQGCAPMHPGQGPGLSLHDLGETGGSDTVTLLQSEIPAHSHALTASNQQGTDQSPINEMFAGGVGGINLYAAPTSITQLADVAVTPAGGDQPHNNMMPYLTLNFCIALQGVYPQRT
jgi:microcystin-dependent protein